MLHLLISQLKLGSNNPLADLCQFSLVRKVSAKITFKLLSTQACCLQIEFAARQGQGS
jgi:hypothetical protein